MRLQWEGKPTRVERVSLPFQTVETINELRATRQRDAETLGLDFGGSAPPEQRNLLVWGGNQLVMSSLLKDHAGRIKLIYIDPPFATGEDFSARAQIGDASVVKAPSILEEHTRIEIRGARLRIVRFNDVFATGPHVRIVEYRWFSLSSLRPSGQPRFADFAARYSGLATSEAK
jgi:hypothetical protein